jgi:glucose/arabinose dehydrogenase
LLNVGSLTDHCAADGGDPPDAARPCPETLGPQAHGLIRRYAMRWPEGRATGFTVEAEGLRNSLTLAMQSASGRLWQAENSRDAINRADPRLKDELLPHDELNLIVAGRNYGWPYCYDMNLPSPEYPAYDCKAKTAPVLLLPPHAAPLSMAIDNDARLPAPFTGAMVLGFHGYRKGGHRVVAYKLDQRGNPAGPAQELVSGWEAQKGVRPTGTPVEVRIAPDGAVFITEDRNGTVLRLVRP